jgi:hypothetical protein
MGMLQNQNPPNVPLAPPAYEQAYLNALNNTLRLFYNNINAVQQLSLAGVNFDLKTLPTDKNYDILRYGDVYRDTQGGTLQTGTNILRIKVPVELFGVLASGAVGTVGTVKLIGLTGVSGTGTVGTVTP